MAGLDDCMFEPVIPSGNSQSTKDKDSHSHLYNTELCAFYKVGPEPQPTVLKSSHTYLAEGCWLLTILLADGGLYERAYLCVCSWTT